MNKSLSTALCVLAVAFAAWLSRPFEPAPELPAGSALADGTVAGEKQALEYFRSRDPELSAALARLEPAERRRKYGRYFAWFQRVGPYRQGQKRDVVRRLHAALGLPAVAASEQVYEWPAGTVLDDGTVAGESEALAYFKEHEPALSRRLAAMEPAARRARFGEKFVWFQRVGNYRKRQKAEMIRQIGDELAIEELARGVRAAGPARREALSAELRARVESLYDSKTGLIEWKLLGLREELSELSRRPVVWLFQPGELLALRRELKEAGASLAARRAARGQEVARAAETALKG
jgi:hypothetical protein